ncbi:MAG TPA: CHAT domain-containing protein [Steroidobacteraceae bacterium]|nr:CHAT domain-containing protein [Steroidobacteraceae bacterium]
MTQPATGVGSIPPGAWKRIPGRHVLACVFVLGGMIPNARATPAFEKCADAVAAQPAVYESYRCYYEVASSSGEWNAAGKHLEALATANPENDWIVFVRAAVAWPEDKARAERLYLEAAQRFEAAGNMRGEVLARANLRTMFYASGRLGEAAREVERVSLLGERAQDREVRIRARVVESQFFISTGSNLGRAHRALLQAEAELDGEAAYWLKQHVLHGLGNVLLLTGQYDDAIKYFRRLNREASDQQDLSTVARAQLSVTNALVEKRSVEPQTNAAPLYADANEALVAARRARDVDLELEALRLLGEVLMSEQPQRARGYVGTCIDRAGTSQRPLALSKCLWIQGRLLADFDPVGAQRAIDQAINLLQYQDGADHGLLAYAWRHAMRIAWQTQSTDAAIATGKQALTAIERLRDLQPGLESRAAAFSAWTQDYYWLSGEILRLATEAPHLADGGDATRVRALLDEGFQISERMRARSLLDRLRAPQNKPRDLDDAALRHRETLLKSIVELNRQLLQSKHRDSAALLSALEALERQEGDAREAQEYPQVSVSPASLAEVQQRLAGNEALLSFQIGVSSWMLAVTHEQVRVFALPDRHALSQSLSLYKGLMRQSSAQLGHAGAALHHQLFRDALDKLPKDIERLLIVPDWPLDSFPLSALAASPGSRPLGSDYEVVLIPSATVWHHWRGLTNARDSGSALVFVDPQLELATGDLAAWRSAIQDAGMSIGPLPHARAEGLGILKQLSGRGELWVGDQASEAALKSSDLSRYSVLHFATHAVIDDSNIDRSAILLSTGTHEQDGLLQSREIADLRLDGQLVVLSSCQSAVGTPVRGEGVLGLARSFLAAGAGLVVGSIWPIRDDHAAEFFEPFYTALGKGRPAGAAFHEAQRQLIEKGLPMEAWAGFVLMGDSSLAPFNRVTGAEARASPAWLIAAVVAAMILLACGWIARERRAARRGAGAQSGVTR